jgi:starch synthase
MSKPRILIVTPEVTYLPDGMGNMAQKMCAKAGGLADVSASLVAALQAQGADVHVALPNYRRMFNVTVNELIETELRLYHSKLPGDRIHLAEDRIFYYRDKVYGYGDEDPLLALVFQREVINDIIPRVRPDLIHCNDWMTGLIPGLAKRLGIPSLFTLHNIHTVKTTLERIEEKGVDTAEFWDKLYYERPPVNYAESRHSNRVDLLGSGIFAAHSVNTVSPSFLDEVVNGQHDSVPPQIRSELQHKKDAGYASGILNAPDPSYDPAIDAALTAKYLPKNFSAWKRENKRAFQIRMGLKVSDDTPLFFWPSRLDPMQKGPELLSDILFHMVSKFRKGGIQFAFVANGAHQRYFHEIVAMHGLGGCVSVRDFDEDLSRCGFAASDFMLMPSRFEPCGLTQMIAVKYGSLPIVHNTGGLKDTVAPMDVKAQTGNGFVFENYDSGGLDWAIGQAMDFYGLPQDIRHREVKRVMTEAQERFTHTETAKQYVALYEKMLDGPIC